MLGGLGGTLGGILEAFGWHWGGQNEKKDRHKQQFDPSEFHEGAKWAYAWFQGVLGGAWGEVKALTSEVQLVLAGIWVPHSSRISYKQRNKETVSHCLVTP